MATVIGEDIEVKFGDGAVYLENVDGREWALKLELDGKAIPEQTAIFANLVTRVENLVYPDNSPVTPETLKSRFPLTFFLKVKNEYFGRLAAQAQGEAEGKSPTTAA